MPSRNPRRHQRNRNRNGNSAQQSGIRRVPACPEDLDENEMTAISAPYNFVPLADWVHFPEWSAQVSHDWPFKDGFSGEIRYRLIAESPLLVGGHQEKNDALDRPNTEVRPFQLPDGRYAIPGSSLKGMIRAVVEIAGFGRMRQVDDRRLSVRDLTRGAAAIYGNRMTETVGKKAYKPRPKSGWLEFDGEGNAWITPCEYARVEHDDLADYLGAADNNNNDDNALWWESVPREPLARTKYERWNKSLQIKFDPGPLWDHTHSKGKKLRYRKATNVGHGKIRGTLVFTGQPAKRDPNKSGRKHLEFIFYDEKQQKKSVPEEVWRAFREIYANNEDWNRYWKRQNRIPVFYLEENGQITSFGLSLMYRLPYRLSIHQALSNSSPRHLEEPAPGTSYDLADLLFGSTHSQEQNAAMRGRVSFQTAVALDDPRPVQAPDTILNSPKPSYYPNYIQQPTRPNAPAKLKGKNYRTLMDQAALLRGFKRYPARSQERTGVQELTPGQREAYSVQSRLHPLPTGTTFEGRILFHNLRREELGALLWAITWGGDKGLRHGLGMGKPFGFGQVRFKIDENESHILANDVYEEQRLSQEKQREFMDDFERYMEEAAREHGGWKESIQIRNLLAMADPEAANDLPDGMELRHMCLDGRNNEFQWAKQPPKNDRERALFVLADYATATGRYQGPPASASNRPPGDRPSSSEIGATRNGRDARLHPWVEEKIAELARRHHARRDDILRGRLLASSWAELEEGEEKQAILDSIVRYWKSRGWWDLETKAKAMKKARKIYRGTEP